MPGAQQQQNPQDFEDYAFSKFGGLDTSSDPTAVSDENFPWIFDIFPVGNGFLVVLPGPLKFASGLAACQWIDYANLSGVDYAIYCDINGKLSAINISTGVVSTITTGLTPAKCQCTVWSDTELLVIDSANGYGNWNGSSFTTINSSLKGTSIAVHQGRVWIANGRTITFSSAGSYTDFTTGSGGGSTPMNDPTLAGDIVALSEKNSILYIFGISSVNAIGDLTVPSGATEPVFSNSNLQASVGTPYIRAIAELQRVIFTPSSAGVYGIYGVNAPKLSDALNGIIDQFSTINGQLHSAVGNVQNQLTYALLGDLNNDNYSGPCLALFANKRWFLAQQGANLSAICTAYVAGVPTMIGADSAGNVYKLFMDDTATAQGRIDTKLFSFTSPVYDHEMIRSGVLVFWSHNDSAQLSVITDTGSQTANLNVSNGITFVNNSGGKLQFQNNSAQDLNFFAFGAALLKGGFQIRGKHVGLSLTLTTPGNVIRAFLMRVRQATPW